MNSMLKRVLSMALAIVMVFGLLPAIAPHVHAATIGGSGLTDTTISLSASDPTGNFLGQKGTVTWTANGTDLTCVAKGNGGVFSVAANSTLTITNTGESGKLAFDWSLTGNGSVSGLISGTAVHQRVFHEHGAEIVFRIHPEMASVSAAPAERANRK